MSEPSMESPPAVLRIKGGRILREERLCELWIDIGRGELRRLIPAASPLLPVPAASARAVSIAGTLEHLDIGAVLTLLLESHRVLVEGGRLVLELPDFEAALEHWARGDESFFRDEAWALDDDAVAAGDARGATGRLDARAAALFCSYRRTSQRADAGAGDRATSWGPPAVDPEVLRGMRARLSPMGLSVELCNLAVDMEEQVRFDRQSAWSRSELAAMLRSVGFEASTFDARAVTAAAAELPGVSIRRTRRMLCLAEPTPSRPADEAGERFREALRLARGARSPEGVGALREAVAREPALAEAHYRLLWDVYTRAIRESAQAGGAPSPTFAREGYHLGRLPSADVEAMRAALARAPIVRVTASDYAPGYMHNAYLSAEGEEAVNRDNDYLGLGPEALACARPLLAALAEPVRACLGTPVRVVNLRSWRTFAHAARAEANGWHRDGPYPPMVLKVMIYLSEAGPETGTTELVREDGARFLASGPPGTFLVFKNFELIHRGVPPSRGERLVLEVTMAPHTTDDLRPVCAGQNADFPLSPWTVLEQP
ncbi:hypothetical protein WMF04_05235 [Sorangium sp. So ce260]|uniref:hypothetical protein n=1 Tax=Sorangium sp. So ce260 TaxID=3133291 RepID=UPI003F5F4473